MATSNRFLPVRLNRSFLNLGEGSIAEKSLLASMLNNPQYINYFDDFVGQSAGTWPASSNWGYPATVGTGTEVIGITAAVGGTLTCTSGGTSGNGAYQYFGLNWQANSGGIYAIWLAKANSVTSAKFEIGLTDSITNEGIVNTLATPTFTATDGVAFCFDTTDTAALKFLAVIAGVSAGTPITVAAAMDTNYHIYEIRVAPNGAVEGYYDGANIGGFAAGVTPSVALGPQVGGATTRTSAAKTTTVDYCGVFGPRG